MRRIVDSGFLKTIQVLMIIWARMYTPIRITKSKNTRSRCVLSAVLRRFLTVFRIIIWHFLIASDPDYPNTRPRQGEGIGILWHPRVNLGWAIVFCHGISSWMISSAISAPIMKAAARQGCWLRKPTASSPRVNMLSISAKN